MRPYRVLADPQGVQTVEAAYVVSESGNTDKPFRGTCDCGIDYDRPSLEALEHVMNIHRSTSSWHSPRTRKQEREFAGANATTWQVKR